MLTPERITQLPEASEIEEGYYLLLDSPTLGTRKFAAENLKPETDLYRWDFTKSLVDEVQGVEAILSGTASRTNEGIFFNSINGSLKLLDSFENGYTLEIQFGNINFKGSSSFYYLIRWPANDSYGFVYYGQRQEYFVRQKGYGDRGAISQSGANVFSNKTLKFIFTSLNDLKIFIDDSQVYSGYSFIRNNDNSTLIINGTNYSLYDSVIKKIRIYANEEG